MEIFSESKKVQMQHEKELNGLKYSNALCKVLLDPACHWLWLESEGKTCHETVITKLLEAAKSITKEQAVLICNTIRDGLLENERQRQALLDRAHLDEPPWPGHEVKEYEQFEATIQNINYAPPYTIVAKKKTTGKSKGKSVEIGLDISALADYKQVFSFKLADQVEVRADLSTGKCLAIRTAIKSKPVKPCLKNPEQIMAELRPDTIANWLCSHVKNCTEHERKYFQNQPEDLYEKIFFKKNQNKNLKCRQCDVKAFMEQLYQTREKHGAMDSHMPGDMSSPWRGFLVRKGLFDLRSVWKGQGRHLVENDADTAVIRVYRSLSIFEDVAGPIVQHAMQNSSILLPWPMRGSEEFKLTTPSGFKKMDSDDRKLLNDVSRHWYLYCKYSVGPSCQPHVHENTVLHDFYTITSIVSKQPLRVIAGLTASSSKWAQELCPSPSIHSARFGQDALQKKPHCQDCLELCIPKAKKDKVKKLSELAGSIRNDFAHGHNFVPNYEQSLVAIVELLETLKPDEKFAIDSLKTLQDYTVKLVTSEEEAKDIKQVQHDLKTLLESQQRIEAQGKRTEEKVDLGNVISLNTNATVTQLAQAVLPMLQDYNSNRGLTGPSPHMLQGDRKLLAITSMLPQYRKHAQHHLLSRKLSRGFQPRGWLYNQIYEQLPLKRLTLVLGPLGVGKSTAMAALVQCAQAQRYTQAQTHFPDWDSKESSFESLQVLAPHVLASFFCEAVDTDTLDPLSFVEQIEGQWKQNIEGYEEAFSRAEQQSRRSRSSAFGRLTFALEVLEQVYPSGPPSLHWVCIVVDSLDESMCVSANQQSIPDLLKKAVAKDIFPSWLHVIATSREKDNENMLASLAGKGNAGKIVIEPKSEVHLSDLCRYAWSELTSKNHLNEFCKTKRVSLQLETKHSVHELGISLQDTWGNRVSPSSDELIHLGNALTIIATERGLVTSKQSIVGSGWDRFAAVLLPIMTSDPQLAGHWWVVTQLLLLSQGMFLYLSLVLSNFERVQIFDALPPGLENYLMDCFSRKLESKWTSARVIFQVILASGRPFQRDELFNIVYMILPKLSSEEFDEIFIVIQAYLADFEGKLF